MPTQSRGFFTCDFCGLALDTLEEATEHEYQCSKRPQQAHLPTTTPSQPPGAPGTHPYPPRGPPYGAMGPMSTAEMEAYGHPHPHGAPHAAGPGGVQKLRSVPLMGPNDRSSTLSQDDAVACQNIELFEASPEHVAEFDASRTGGMPVVLRQVGIRCMHLPKGGMDATASYSTAFPPSLGAIAASVRMIADHHLAIDRHVPPEVRSVCERAAKKRQSMGATPEGRALQEEDERARMALLDYCVGFCQHMGIMNKQPHKTGIAFADTEGQPPHPGAPPTPADTPGVHRGPGGAPYSNERMGPPMSYDRRTGYPTPGGPPMGMQGMMGGPMGPGDAIAPTPLQRRRPGPADSADRSQMYSADRSDSGAPSTGYPTPYSQGPPGSEQGYGQEVATPAQPNFEGKDGAYPTPRSAPPSAHPSESSPGYNQYDLPGNFPYYQETDRTWHCKFCSHIHPSYRDPQAIWSSPGGGPPPGSFIDGHLSLCRAYHQSMSSPPMYQGPPAHYPPYMSGYPPPPPPGWEGHSPTHAGGMHPQHLQYPPPGAVHPGEPPYPYPPQPMEHPPRGYPGGPEEHAYGDQRARLVPPGATQVGMPPHPGMAGRPGMPPPRKENLGDVMRHSITHLVTRDTEYLARDQGAKTDRLVLDEDKLLLTDYFFYLMKQLRLCRFSESDRKTRGGKREKIKLGYGGLQCIHCADVPNSRKFFWSNVDRLANSFAEIPGHVLKCRRCPQQTKEALMQLKQFHPEQMARLPRGSQKVFFRRMWRRLHDEDSQANAAATADQSNSENVAPGSPEKKETPKTDTPEMKREEGAVKTEEIPADDSPVIPQMSTIDAAKALTDSLKVGDQEGEQPRILLSIPEDKEWLSDMDCFIRKQLEVFCVTDADVAMAQADRKYPVQTGQVGIRCIHCSMSSKEGAHGTAVAYPFAISGIYESVREFQRLHLDSCEHLPEGTKAKLTTFKGSSSLSSVLRKYYVLAAKALGLHDTREGIRAGGEPVPLGSQATFSFAEASSAPPAHMTSGYSPETSTKASTPVASSQSPSSVPPSSDKKREAPEDASKDVVKQEEPPTGETTTNKEPPSKKSKTDSDEETPEEPTGDSAKTDDTKEKATEDKPEETKAEKEPTSEGAESKTAVEAPAAESSEADTTEEAPVNAAENAAPSEETTKDEVTATV